LFGSRAAAPLPRFTATCRAWPGLTVGSALDDGPDWADGAITRGGRLVAREVDSGIVVPLVPLRCLEMRASGRLDRSYQAARDEIAWLFLPVDLEAP
jgi:hypothetical protein